jgi:hypothetical protein
VREDAAVREEPEFQDGQKPGEKCPERAGSLRTGSRSLGRVVRHESTVKGVPPDRRSSSRRTRRARRRRTRIAPALASKPPRGRSRRGRASSGVQEEAAAPPESGRAPRGSVRLPLSVQPGTGRCGELCDRYLLEIHMRVARESPQKRIEHVAGDPEQVRTNAVARSRRFTMLVVDGSSRRRGRDPEVRSRGASPRSWPSGSR